MSANPLSQNVPLPADMLEALGEYRKAISETKKELRDLEREAKRVSEATGATDPGLAARIHGLQSLKGSLEQRLENMSSARAAKAEEKALATSAAESEALSNARISFARAGILRAAGAADVAGGAMLRGVGTVQSAASYVAYAAQKMGFAGAAETAKAMSSVAGSAGKFLATRAAIPIALASSAISMFSDHFQAMEMSGQAANRQTDRFFSLTGGPIAGVAAEDAQYARLAFRGLQSAEERGRAVATIGLGGRIQQMFGMIPTASIAYGEELAEHEKRLLEAKQTYGQSYDPYKNEQVRNTANLAFKRKTEFSRDFLSALSYYSRGLYYAAGNSGYEYRKREYEEELRKAADKDIEDEKKRRSSELFAWNAGVRGAVNRVLEHEQRRHLAVVEQDRVNRWATWGMQ